MIEARLSLVWLKIESVRVAFSLKKYPKCLSSLKVSLPFYLYSYERLLNENAKAAELSENCGHFTFFSYPHFFI